LPGSPDTRLNFVHHQQDSMASSPFLKSLEEARWSWHEPTFAKNRLEKKSGGLIRGADGGQQIVEFAKRKLRRFFERAAVSIRVGKRRKDGSGHERGKARAVLRTRRSQSRRTVGASMET